LKQEQEEEQLAIKEAEEYKAKQAQLQKKREQARLKAKEQEKKRVANEIIAKKEAEAFKARQMEAKKTFKETENHWQGTSRSIPQPGQKKPRPIKKSISKKLGRVQQTADQINNNATLGSLGPAQKPQTATIEKKKAQVANAANATNDIDTVQLTFLGSRLIIPYSACHTTPYELVALWKTIFTFLDLRQYRFNKWTAKNQYVFQLRTYCRLFYTVLQPQKSVAVDLRKENIRKLTINDKSSKPAKKSRKWTTGDLLRPAIVKQADDYLNLNDVISTTDVFGQFVRPDLRGKLL
jgi:hypothetical protein